MPKKPNRLFFCFFSGETIYSFFFTEVGLEMFFSICTDDRSFFFITFESVIFFSSFYLSESDFFFSFLRDNRNFSRDNIKLKLKDRLKHG